MRVSTSSYTVKVRQLVLLMAKVLEKLCSKVSLSEGEKGGIHVTEGEVAEGKEVGARCLVGKLW